MILQKMNYLHEKKNGKFENIFSGKQFYKI